MLRSARGFTLLELLIGIIIVGILAIVGVLVFSGSKKLAEDSKRRSDIDTISKVYETRYSNFNKYVAVTGSDFGGTIPKDPDGVSDYYQALASDGSSFRVCAALAKNPARVCSTPSATCICKDSSLSTLSIGATLDQIAGGIAPTSVPTGSPTGVPTGVPVATVTPTITPTPIPAPFQMGMRGYWTFDEPSGTTVADSVNSNNGVAIGTTIVPGKLGLGNARHFNGLSDYINVPSAGLSDLTSSLSMSVWIKADTALPTDKAFISKDGFNSGFSLEYKGGAPKRFIFYASGTTTAGVNSTTSGPLSLVNWYHLVAVYDNSVPNMKLYVNGVLENTVTSSVPTNLIDSGTSLIFGNTTEATPKFWKGNIDEIGIWDRALTLPEVQYLYNGGSGRPYGG